MLVLILLTLLGWWVAGPVGAAVAALAVLVVIGVVAEG